MKDNYKDLTDDELIFVLKLGDENVIRTIYTRYGACINGLIIGRIGLDHSEDTDKILVETFCRFYYNRQDLPQKRLLTILIFYAHSTLFDYGYAGVKQRN